MWRNKKIFLKATRRNLAPSSSYVYKFIIEGLSIHRAVLLVKCQIYLSRRYISCITIKWYWWPTQYKKILAVPSITKLCYENSYKFYTISKFYNDLDDNEDINNLWNIYKTVFVLRIGGIISCEACIGWRGIFCM